METPDFSVFLSGKVLYGDDFNLQLIHEWYRDEENGYADLGAGNKSEYSYSYHALNWRHGFRILDKRSYSNALGFGSAYGDEFLPIEERLASLVLLDASERFQSDGRLSIPTRFCKANPNGDLPFGADSFDLLTCFGVLHHIPNVTHVMNEFYRCLKPGGVALIREPVTSMGDWRKARRGLTKRERGIPFDVFIQIASEAGFHVKQCNWCMFPLTPRLWKFIGDAPYNNLIAVRLDGILSWLTKWNNSYHRESFFKKLAPACVFLVLEKPSTNKTLT